MGQGIGVRIGRKNAEILKDFWRLALAAGGIDFWRIFTIFAEEREEQRQGMSAVRGVVIWKCGKSWKRSRKF